MIDRLQRLAIVIAAFSILMLCMIEKQPKAADIEAQNESAYINCLHEWNEQACKKLKARVK